MEGRLVLGLLGLRAVPVGGLNGTSSSDNMVFTLGLRHTFDLWQRSLALVQFPVVRTLLASFRAVS